MTRYPGAELVIIGSTRNQEDESLQRSLEARAKELGLSNRVRFVVNASFKVLMEWMALGHVGLHSMWNEHFGISVVESMASGLVMIAHDSAGPRGDIVVPALRAGDLQESAKVSKSKASPAAHAGYLATTPEEYAVCLQDALDTVAGKKSGKEGLLALQQRARSHVGGRFSDGTFTFFFQNLFRSLLREREQEEQQSLLARAKAALLAPLRDREAATKEKHD